MSQPLIRKAPFLDMTDLYTKPGTADEVVASLADHPEAQALFAAEIGGRLHISKTAAKKAVYKAMNKTGVDKREKLGAFV